MAKRSRIPKKPLKNNYTKFTEYKNIHKDETVIVCGCGHSLKTLKHPEKTITIGVNDVGRQFTPDYLVVLNPKNQFKGDRFKYVENSQAKALFTQLNLGVKHPNTVKFKLGKRGGTQITDLATLPFTRNSPYVALSLAMYMGAKRIGLIGVDFTQHHFFANSGKHTLSLSLKTINLEYQKLYKTAQSLGIEIVNLSQESRISAFPKSTLDDFYSHKIITKLPKLNHKTPKENPAIETESAEKPLNIVSYSTTPVAGVPVILSACINRFTEHQCRCVWATNSYGNGVSFATDVEWKSQPKKAMQLLKNADVVIVHNGKVAAQHTAILKNKAVITMAHNYIWNVDQSFIKRGYPGVVVAQYQACLPEFKGWTPVPNPILLQPSKSKPVLKNKEISICYTPSGKHEIYPKKHRLYWHSKGYDTTMAILTKLAKQYPIILEVIKDKQLPHKQVQAMKARSHIVIDECVTGSYHRNSLEGLENGCVVINGMGILKGLDTIFEKCTGSQSPFIGCSLNELESVLINLIEKGRETLLQNGQKNRQWIEQYWSFARQWQTIWLPEIDQAMDKCRGIGAKTPLTPDLINAEQRKPMLLKNKKPVVAVKPKISKTSKLGQINIPVYWTCRKSNRGNFGDMLSPGLTKALSGKNAVFRTSGSRLFAVGSLIKFANKGDVVWGTGFISDNDKCKRGVIVNAVRGPLTREKLLQQGIDCPEVYGDPGLLLPALYPQKNVARKGIGIIPHYVDYERVRSQLSAKGFRVIDVRAGIEPVIKAATQCEVLLCSSLHGCILGESYGIPTAWVELSDKVVGKGFKFRDYYAASDRDPVRIDWRQQIDIDAAVNLALDAESPKMNLLPLVDAFPYPSAKIGEVRGRVAELATPSVKKEIAVVGNVNSGANIAARPISESFTVDDESTLDPVLEHKIAVFGAVTENYTEYMIASLRSFMKHNSNAEIKYDYFILGSSFSARTQRLINKFGIRYININLNREFTRNIRHRYPGECFWIFKGPELFANRGYQYSLAIDGDTLCNKPLDTRWLKDLKHIAGVNRGCGVGTFLANLKQLDSLKKGFTLDEGTLKRPATNSGVLFFNNGELAKAKFYTRMVKTYQRSERLGVLRGGDDSTLALFLASHPEIDLHIIDDSWNVYRGISGVGNSAVLDKLSVEANIIHLSSLKPWRHHIKFPNTLLKNAIEEWRSLWPNSKNQRRMRSIERSKQRQGAVVYKPGSKPAAKKTTTAVKINSAKPTKHRPPEKSLGLDLYWYRGKTLNMGDEIAPYLISKILDIPIHQYPSKPIKDPAKSINLALLSVGSIMRLCGSNTIVWGSGIRNIDQPVKKAAKFCAVRGPLTRRRLLQLGYSCPEVYGDPAVLLPKYYFPDIAKRYALGIVPHLVDRDAIKKLYGNNKDVLIIDLQTGDIESVIRQILSCGSTLSSSLHGLILSVAYGIPTKWIKCAGKIMGDDTKFYDYFASLNPEVCEVLDYTRVTIPGQGGEFECYRPLIMSADFKFNIKKLSGEVYKHRQTIELDRLQDAFPFDYFRSVGMTG